MLYKKPDILSENVGNRALAPASWKGDLVIPEMQKGTFLSVQEGENIVFVAEDEFGLCQAKEGLLYFVETEFSDVPVRIFDNHNHALFFWYDAREKWYIQDGATLVHIDEHSDLWGNEFVLTKPDSFDLERVYDFVKNRTNVGNYILPARAEWLIGEVIRIEWEGDLLREKNRIIPKNSILNLDLDFFAPELDDISFDLKKTVILHFAKQVSYITIATSPFFIDQKRAIEYLQRVFL